MSAPTTTFWFLDTSSLLSMALDEGIEVAILDEIGGDHVVIIDIVQEELTRRASVPETAGLAKNALSRIHSHWTIMKTERYVTLEDVQLAQEDVADGRTLTDDMQHWAESTIIALARKSASAGLTSIKMLLSEDYDARRVASTVPHTYGVSIHVLLHERVQSNRMTAEAAAALGGILQAAGRGPAVTASDFADPTGCALGRVAMPRDSRIWRAVPVATGEQSARNSEAGGSSSPSSPAASAPGCRRVCQVNGVTSVSWVTCVPR